MKALLLVLLTMFVCMSIMGCYKNSSIATECGKHYTIYTERTDMSLRIHEFLLEEGYEADLGYYYKQGQISYGSGEDRRSMTFAIIVNDWVEHNRKLKYDIYTKFGDYKCEINGFNENFKYFDDLIERIVLKLEE